MAILNASVGSIERVIFESEPVVMVFFITSLLSSVVAVRFKPEAWILPLRNSWKELELSVKSEYKISTAEVVLPLPIVKVKATLVVEEYVSTSASM